MSNAPAPWSLDRQIPSFLGSGQEVQESILSRLGDCGWTEQDLFGIRLALEEALANAIKHGNRHDACKQVHVRCELTAERLYIEIADEGPGFDPRSVPDPTDDEHLEVPSGRGIMLMKAFMCRVEYNARGNCVVMEKRRELGS